MTLYLNPVRTAYWPLELQQLFSLAVEGLRRIPSWLEWPLHIIHRHRGSRLLMPGNGLGTSQSNKSKGLRFE